MPDYIKTATGVFKGTFDKIGSLSWIFTIIIILIVLGVIGYIAINYKKHKGKWSLRIRVRQEDTINKKIYLDPAIVKARRITLSNGIKMMLLEKPIFGKRLMPLLNYYTKPGVYDLVLTADNRIFLITGIEGIDKQRKILNVGIRYPGIDQDFDEINQAYQQLNKDDGRNSILDFIKAASIGIMAICLLIAVIIGGKYWVDAKQADVQINSAQVEVFEQLRLASIYNTEYANAMNLLIPKLQTLYGGQSLQSQIKIQTQVNQSDT